MKPLSSSPSLSVAIAIAALAFIVACGSHEILGHGATCVAEGSRITLLTSVYFRCENGGVITDLAGPFANLLLGLGACLLLEKRTWSPNTHLFFVLSLAFNIFWLAGCMFVSAVANKSDFAYALRLLAAGQPGLWQAMLGILGLIVYWVGMRMTSKHADPKTPFAVAYATAGIVSCGAALFFLGSVAPALREAALESFGSALGLLLLSRATPRRLAPRLVSEPPGSGYGWVAAGVLGTIAFCLLLGRGMVVTANA